MLDVHSKGKLFLINLSSSDVTFLKKLVKNNLATLINWMGGSVRRTLDSTTTHLVAYRCAGEKVRRAAIIGRRQVVHTMKKAWVLEAWACRKDSHRARVFQEVCIAFVGFSPDSDELLEMHSLVLEHDGAVTEDLNDTRLSHVVVTDASSGSENIQNRLCELLVIDVTRQQPLASEASARSSKDFGVTAMTGMSYRVPVLRLDWFWRSVQLTCLCQIQPYLYVMVRTNSTGLPVPPLARRGGDALGMGTESPAGVDGGGDVSRLWGSQSLLANSLNSTLSQAANQLGMEEDSIEGREGLCEIGSPGITTEKENVPPPAQHLAVAGITTPVAVWKTGRSLASGHCEKVSFVTSPRVRGSPRGFLISPPAPDTPRTPDSHLLHRSAGSLGGGLYATPGDASRLFSQLTDPLNLPSNRELLQHRASSSGLTESSPPPASLASAEDSFHSLPVSGSGSTLSQVLLSPTNAPLGCTSPTHGVKSSGVEEAEEVSCHQQQVNAEVPATVSESPTVCTPVAPVLQLTASALMTNDYSTPLSPATSSKRKSVGRLSLLHATGRKSRTPTTSIVTSPSQQQSASQESCLGSQLHGQNTPLWVRLEKRQHRVFEFFVTERNYVQILRYLYRTAYPQVVDEEQSGGALLPRLEADQVFGKLATILELHERLQPQLDQLEAHWDLAESRLGEVLHLGLLEEMDKCYGNYMQFYSQPHLQRLGEHFPRFLAFMRQVERRRESGRQSLSALLVRPVQRLPSVSLLMEGIVKFTPAQHPDYAAMSQFAKGLNRLLTGINDRMRKNEERLSLLSLYHEINGAPPEMLSSSRSLVMRIEVFELGASSSTGHTTCEPVTLFLLTDSLEVVRPRRRHTGEPLNYAIQAALTAVQGETGVSVEVPAGDQQVPAGSLELGGVGPPDQPPSVSLSRTGSGASGRNSRLNLGLSEAGVTSSGAGGGGGGGGAGGGGGGGGGAGGKQRGYYKHLQLLKLQDVKRVVNFDTASPDRAAFGLVVRSMTAEADDRVHAYCLAASLAASAAVSSGRCPEALETVLRSTTTSVGAYAPSLATSTSSVATLQHCVGEVKRLFLYRLCHHIAQASCLVNTPEELLVDVESEELLGFDLEQVFNSITQQAIKSKKFTRQLTRNISVKTPRRPAPSYLKRPFTSAILHGNQFSSVSSRHHLLPQGAGVEGTPAPRGRLLSASAVADDLLRAVSAIGTVRSSTSSLFMAGSQSHSTVSSFPVSVSRR